MRIFVVAIVLACATNWVSAEYHWDSLDEHVANVGIQHLKKDVDILTALHELLNTQKLPNIKADDAVAFANQSENLHERSEVYYNLNEIVTKDNSYVKLLNEVAQKTQSSNPLVHHFASTFVAHVVGKPAWLCIETVEDALDLIKDETQRKTKKRAEKAFDEFVQEITEYMAGQKAESATTVYLPISSNNQLLMDVAKAFKHTNINATIEAINKALNHFVSLID